MVVKTELKLTRDYSYPRWLRQLRQFGQINFYRRFLFSHKEITHYLQDLLRRGKCEFRLPRWLYLLTDGLDVAVRAALQ